MRLVSPPAAVGLSLDDFSTDAACERLSGEARQRFPGPHPGGFYLDTNVALLQFPGNCCRQFLHKEAALELLCLPLQDPFINYYGAYLPNDIRLWFNKHPLKNRSQTQHCMSKYGNGKNGDPCHPSTAVSGVVFRSDYQKYSNSFTRSSIGSCTPSSQAAAKCHLDEHSPGAVPPALLLQYDVTNSQRRKKSPLQLVEFPFQPSGTNTIAVRRSVYHVRSAYAFALLNFN